MGLTGLKMLAKYRHSLAQGVVCLSSKPATLHCAEHASVVTSPSGYRRKGSLILRIPVTRLGPLEKPGYSLQLKFLNVVPYAKSFVPHVRQYIHMFFGSGCTQIWEFFFIITTTVKKMKFAVRTFAVNQSACVIGDIQ